MSTTSSLTEYRHRIQKVIDYINGHLTDELPLDVLAGTACFSSFHFHRIFSEMTGETPSAFVNRLRLERAANKLQVSASVSVTEIAFSCGFSSSATFSRSFKKFFGISATQWRDRSKNGKTDSKIGKARASRGLYIESVESILQSSSERNISVNITIKQLPTRHVAYAANLEGYGDKAMDAVWRTIIGWAGAHGMFDRATKMIGISFDNPDITPKEKCRYYACVTVPQGTITTAGINVMDLPGGTYAVKHFEGRQSGIAGAYTDLYRQWLPQSGYVPVDSPCYEISMSTPDQIAQGIFVMDICLPIKPI